jgi:superfamily II DNA or RNA helicase
MARTAAGSPAAGNPKTARQWMVAIAEDFSNFRKKSGFLPLAEQAIAEHPDDPSVLFYAITAALLDDRNDRALYFSKTLSKLYIEHKAEHLLNALTLMRQNRRKAARELLERHELTTTYDAMPYFPGGWARSKWLSVQLDQIMGRETPVLETAKEKTKGKTTAKGASKGASKSQQQSAAPDPAPTPSAPGLPLIDIDISFGVEFNLEPLAAAVSRRPERDGAWYLLRQRLAHLGLAQGFDELLCLPHLRGVEAFWHQVETVRKVLKQFRGRVLLADEVGLGKTIEAGMALKEYLLRGMAERVLVLTPASLVGQWREELETKFDISCASTHDALLREDPDKFWGQKRVIASLAAARRKEHAERLHQQNFDIVVVDEAHHLRDRASASYKLVDKLNKRFLLLLSATPVQNDLIELYNLLTLLKPGIFKTLKEFKAAYMVSGKPRQPANPDRLRELMRGAMIRNTRAVVALKLPRRHAVTIRVDGEKAEREAYRDLAALARQLGADGGSGPHRMALRHLLGAAGSSPAAAAAAVGRMAERRPKERSWKTMAKRWETLGAGAKETALIDLLKRNPAEKKLVFVHFRETLTRLGGLLKQAGIAFASFDGSLTGPEKDAAIVAFRDQVPVLLCTESGGEGRNIQFCNTLINFDVPWNPMAIEQRIGRIDRIGQQREVFVFNLVTRDTLEEQVLQLLDEKISMFELVVGEVGAILGGLEEDRDFAEIMLDAWLETTDSSRAEAFDAIGRSLEQARKRHDGAKELDDALFGEDFGTA